MKLLFHVRQLSCAEQKLVEENTELKEHLETLREQVSMFQSSGIQQLFEKTQQVKESEKRIKHLQYVMQHYSSHNRTHQKKARLRLSFRLCHLLN